MPLLGQDFNPARPTDGDFTRHPSREQGATVIRDLKARLKDFFDGVFFLDTGDLKNSVVPSSALQSLSPNPEGTYRTFTINSKGQCTDGDAERGISAPRCYRALFFGSTAIESTVDRDDGFDVITGKPSSSPNSNSNFARTSGPYVLMGTTFNHLEFLFTVPPRVTRLRVMLTGGSPFYTSPTSWSSDSRVTRIGSFDVTQGQLLRIFCGTDAASPCRIADFTSTVYFDNTQVQSGTINGSFKTLAAPWHEKFGGVAGNPSLVTLEWYA